MGSGKVGGDEVHDTLLDLVHRHRSTWWVVGWCVIFDFRLFYFHVQRAVQARRDGRAVREHPHCANPSSLRALSGRLKFTVRRHTFNKDSFCDAHDGALDPGLSILNTERAVQARRDGGAAREYPRRDHRHHSRALNPQPSLLLHCSRA